MKGLPSFSRAGTFTLKHHVLTDRQHSTKWKSPQEGPYYQVLGNIVLKHSHQTNTGYNHSGYHFGLPNHLLLKQNIKNTKSTEAHSSNSKSIEAHSSNSKFKTHTVCAKG